MVWNYGLATMKPEKAHYVVATAIIVKDSKFLLLKRANHEKVFPGRWTVPGGKLERDDYENKPKDSEDAWYHIGEKLVEREVMEEAGIKVKDVKYATSLVFMREDNIPVVVLSYFANIMTRERLLLMEATQSMLGSH